MSGRPQVATITGAEKPVRQEARRVGRSVGVALHQHRPPHHNVAVHTRCDRLIITIENVNFAAEHWPPVGVRKLLVGVPWCTNGDHRALGHAVAVSNLHPDFTFHLPEQFGRLWRATTDQRPQRWKDRLAGRTALSLQERLIVRGASAERRHPVATHHGDGNVGHKCLKQQGPEPDAELHNQIVRATDMGVRKRHATDFSWGEVGRRRHAETAGNEGAVRMTNRFR